MSEAQVALQPEMELPPADVTVRWTLGTRIAFRFVFVYFALYCLPFPLNWVPYMNYLAGKYHELWHWITPRVSQHVLHLTNPITVFTNGSGDTTYDYVTALSMLILAVAATLIWSVLDRKRPSYPKLQQWFKLYLRFALAQHMIGYGAAKVIKTQFPDLRLSDMMTTYGQSTPMHLLWAMMGASKTYNVFTGGVEMLGGILLIMPRLTLLGSLVSIGAMANVFILNMSYDVPVKLFSFHLLMMAMLLAAPDLHRLADLFVFNRRVGPASYPPMFRRRWLNYGLLGLQLVFGLYLAGSDLYGGHRAYMIRGGGAPKPLLRGIWAVDDFSVGGERQAQTPEAGRWQQVIFDDYLEVLVQSTDGWRQRYLHNVDREKKTISVWKREGQFPERPQFNFELPQPDTLVLDGELDGRRIHAKLHRMLEPKFMLTSRGFHWINEYPFNRYDEH